MAERGYKPHDLCCINHHVLHDSCDGNLRHLFDLQAIAVVPDKQSAGCPGGSFIPLLEGVRFANRKDELGGKGGNFMNVMVLEIIERAVKRSFESASVSKVMVLSGRLHDDLVEQDSLVNCDPQRFNAHLAR
jgi:hypothetical protein